MFRSIIMCVIVLLVAVYVGLYVVLSVPTVQNRVKERVCREVSGLLGGDVGISTLTVHPFSELVLTGVVLESPEGERCASIGKVAAGIDLWSLMYDRKIVLNYAEIIGLDVRIEQNDSAAPLNIQFLIDALTPKDKTKPPTLFDLKIRNVVVRDSRASFSRPWLMDRDGGSRKMAEMDMTGLRIDVSIPVLRNDLFRFDVRNIQFDVSPGVNVRRLSAHVSLMKDTAGSADRLLVKDLSIGLPNSSFTVGDIDLSLDSIVGFDASVGGWLTPADFAGLLPELEPFNTSWNVDFAGTVSGNAVDISELSLVHPSSGSHLRFSGGVNDIRHKDSLDARVDVLQADLSALLLSEAVPLIPGLGEKGRVAVLSLGQTVLDMKGSMEDGESGDVKGSVKTEAGVVDFEASATRIQSKRPHIRLAAEFDGIELDRILASERVGRVSGSIDAELTGADKDAEGWIILSSDECELMGNLLNGVELEVSKSGNDIELLLEAATEGSELRLNGGCRLAGVASSMDAELTLSDISPSAFGMKGKMAACLLAGGVKVSAQGNSPDNLTGFLSVNDLCVTKPDGMKLELSRLTVSVDTLDDAAVGTLLPQRRDIRLSSDWFDARITGRLVPSTISSELKGMAATVLPTLIPGYSGLKAEPTAQNDFTFSVNVKGVSAPYSFFNVPLRPLTDIPVRGEIKADEGKASVSISTPHLLQGKNKLLRDVAFDIDLDSFLGMAKVRGGLIFPAKKGDAELAADINAMRDKVNVSLGINPTIESGVKGGVALTASLFRLPDPFNTPGTLGVTVELLPSTVMVNGKSWSLADGMIDYSGKRITVDNFLISHDDQFVKISGAASDSPNDMVKVMLNDIDLEYIFNILNINYVSFGGMATGEIAGSRLLTKQPEARTEFLRVKGLSYNGAVIGDADLASDYDARQQKVGIYGVIRDSLTRERRAAIDGGIWVTRDSLSFDFDADRVNVGVMKPFVSAFCSDLYGVASGKCKLFGTFSDIDLVGALRADTLSMKLDFTNTWYHAGGDSVFMRRGIIDIPPLTLYDDERHSAEFSGWLKHTYFHNPVFGFKLKDAKSLLCYNTNEKMNPLWYGTIYGSGHAQINGHPGLIEIDMNMTTEEGSKFYYVISEAEDVAQYSFLSFTDRRKESVMTQKADTVPDYLKTFRKQKQEMEEGSSNVVLSLKGTVTNDALVTLVMDPRAGDNITARGQGALQMDYNLASNDLRMIGTYVLDEGNYNFTLQDIIIKNFNIRKGSMIKFDGDPMKAVLDIAATYRVNTNLTDLDKSFSTDKELNRTNVPVDAVLLVDGPMTNPDITFDIDLPSLTSDVERKVKSIISTNDMMSRQIIYLLALNRFYTPEYTEGQNSSGSEWSSMASSTISSQLSNILSQMTDKLDVAPSFRSDKGDFSDMEFDLALSSRLLNNRLLINGNFGYRDRNTSNTQFVGDFDIEYLLSKNGNLRLKAYNHFNDQSYYLRSALTTQGVGIVFRRDFDRLFGRKRKEARDTIGSERNAMQSNE